MIHRPLLVLTIGVLQNRPSRSRDGVILHAVSTTLREPPSLLEYELLMDLSKGSVIHPNSPSFEHLGQKNGC